MRNIESLKELESLVGQEVTTSDWILVSQDHVNMFAEATGDRQWIHLDVERCRKESPFGEPVAHGFLTLSLLPRIFEEALTMPPAKMSVNYGLNKVRFPAPLPAGSRVRGRLELLALLEIPGGIEMTWRVSIEREGSDKPVCVAESISRQYV